MKCYFKSPRAPVSLELGTWVMAITVVPFAVKAAERQKAAWYSLVCIPGEQQKQIFILWHQLLLKLRCPDPSWSGLNQTHFQSCLYGFVSWSCLPVYYAPDCFHWLKSSTQGKEIFQGFISPCRGAKAASVEVSILLLQADNRLSKVHTGNHMVVYFMCVRYRAAIFSMNRLRWNLPTEQCDYYLTDVQASRIQVFCR